MIAVVTRLNAWDSVKYILHSHAWVQGKVPRSANIIVQRFTGLRYPLSLGQSLVNDCLSVYDQCTEDNKCLHQRSEIEANCPQAGNPRTARPAFRFTFKWFVDPFC